MKPIDMVLFCPNCGMQHIDAPEVAGEPEHPSLEGKRVLWTNPPHRSHLCHACGHIWRPADVATNGVEAVKTSGTMDSPAKRYWAEGRSGLDPQMGWLIDAATRGELAAYDAGCQGMMAALQRILDGKDEGSGVSNEPWESLRRQVLALKAKS